MEVKVIPNIKATSDGDEGETQDGVHEVMVLVREAAREPSEDLLLELTGISSL